MHKRNTAHGGWGWRVCLKCLNANTRRKKFKSENPYLANVGRNGRWLSCLKAKWRLIIDTNVAASKCLWRPSFQLVSLALIVRKQICWNICLQAGVSDNVDKYLAFLKLSFQCSQKKKKVTWKYIFHANNLQTLVIPSSPAVIGASGGAVTLETTPTCPKASPTWLLTTSGVSSSFFQSLK